MTWFYVSNGQQAGPVDEAQLADLARSGVVQPETLVWKEGMANWQPYRTVAPAPPAPPPLAMAPPLPPPTADAGFAGGRACSHCGQIFPDSQLVAIGSGWSCAACKPVALQKLQQGTWSNTASRRYAGFWIRFAALFIDWLILSVASAIIAIPLGLSIAFDPTKIENIGALFAMMGTSSLLNTAIQAAYHAYFVSQMGATPGKMVFGLQVIRSDGSRLTPGRAVGRFFAHILSGIILLIGYIIAAFDSEKRALHDHICDTRVIYKS